MPPQTERTLPFGNLPRALKAAATAFPTSLIAPAWMTRLLGSMGAAIGLLALRYEPRITRTGPSTGTSSGITYWLALAAFSSSGGSATHNWNPFTLEARRHPPPAGRSFPEAGGRR